MIKHKIEIDEVCKSCEGTGLYVGLGERDGVGVVCYKCKGTGCYHFVYEYEDFKKRLPRKDIKWVIEYNPGICVGLGNNRYQFEDFGGMSFVDWKGGKPFQVGMEMRKFVCPAWWYQGVDYSKKPEWDWCNSSWGSSFSDCRYFKAKDKCWEKWDKKYTKND